jgi:hypothetical protein
MPLSSPLQDSAPSEWKAVCLVCFERNREFPVLAPRSSKIAICSASCSCCLFFLPSRRTWLTGEALRLVVGKRRKWKRSATAVADNSIEGRVRSAASNRSRPRDQRFGRLGFGGCSSAAIATECMAASSRGDSTVGLETFDAWGRKVAQREIVEALRCVASHWPPSAAQAARLRERSQEPLCDRCLRLADMGRLRFLIGRVRVTAGSDRGTSHIEAIKHRERGRWRLGNLKVVNRVNV